MSRRVGSPKALVTALTAALNSSASSAGSGGHVRYSTYVRSGNPPSPRQEVVQCPERTRSRTPAPRVLAIASGKGGVGKSSVTTNLAVALAQHGQGRRRDRRRRVGLLDAPDARRSRTPPELDRRQGDHPAVGPRRPADLDGLLRARGPGRDLAGPDAAQGARAVPHRREWGEPDYLLIDMPPGTGDVSLSMSPVPARAPRWSIVTTPQPAAQSVAQRAAAMAEKVELDVIGVIENMSWFRGDDGMAYEIFGSGGGQELADQLERPAARAGPARARRCARAATPAHRSWSPTPSPKRRAPSSRSPSRSRRSPRPRIYRSELKIN